MMTPYTFGHRLIKDWFMDDADFLIHILDQQNPKEAIADCIELADGMELPEFTVQSEPYQEGFVQIIHLPQAQDITEPKYIVIIDWLVEQQLFFCECSVEGSYILGQWTDTAHHNHGETDGSSPQAFLKSIEKKGLLNKPEMFKANYE
ncbi:hypothetical protein [Paraferrimonas sp. SM1919]|uniref:hypothetical protein n=1 Tax=Paraferrimonas sp. SM1919 TaxID=2662263 RepID=UPI0013D4C78D|nr:hypothetical protein [Paraferrimonas sp. SM1919]